MNANFLFKINLIVGVTNDYRKIRKKYLLLNNREKIVFVIGITNITHEIEKLCIKDLKILEK